MQIEVADAASAQRSLPQLVELIVRTVEGGASIGWLPPLATDDATSYWRGRIGAVTAGTCVLLLAWDGETLVGTAQLALEPRPNGNHRAEVQKVMVRDGYRRQGIARQLMVALEEQARRHGRSLLFLDTREGDVAELLYRQMGYARAGAIPNYVRSERGGFDATVLYYKWLG